MIRNSACKYHVYIYDGGAGIEIGTVSAGSGVVRQQVVRHEMFGSRSAQCGIGSEYGPV